MGGDKESTSAVKDECSMDVEDGLEKKAVVAEPSSEVLNNPARVVPEQEKFIKFREDSRYTPLKLKRAPSGFVMLRDMTPSEPVELVSTDAPVSAGGAGAVAANTNAVAMVVEDNEVPPPEPFEYVP